MTKSKEDLVREIILNSNESLVFSDVVEEFEDKSKFSVSRTYVKEVSRKMEEEGLVKVKKVRDNGNLVNIVKVKK